MEQIEPPDQPKGTTTDVIEPKTNVLSQKEAAVSPQMNANGMGKGSFCPHSMGKTDLNYVYAIGKIELRFPTLGIEKEFAQVTSRGDTKGQTDQQALKSVLSKPENRYLLRHMCWVFTIEGIETYILQPRDIDDFSMFMESIRSTSRIADLDVIIGIRGPIASPDLCNGLMVPIVLVDQTYNFDVDSLIKTIPKPEKMIEEKFGPAAEELFSRIIQISDNAGATDEQRAVNYLAMRYSAIYALASKQFEKDFSITSIDIIPSRLSGTRKIVDVVFTYTNRQTGVDEKFFVRVDVTEEFPFLVTKLSPYFDK